MPRRTMRREDPDGFRCPGCECVTPGGRYCDRCRAEGPGRAPRDIRDGTDFDEMGEER